MPQQEPPILSYASPPPSRAGRFSLFLAILALGLYVLLLVFFFTLGKPTGDSPVKLVIVANLCSLVASAVAALACGIVALRIRPKTRRACAVSGIVLALLALACLAVTA